MAILAKIWAVLVSVLKSFYAALTKEPENNQLDVGIQDSGDDSASDSTDPEP